MVPDVNLKEIQRKVYMTFFQDGVWDIALGIFLLCWGLMMIADFFAVAGGVFVTFYFLVFAFKRWLTYPRIGYVKMAEARKQQVRIVIAGAVLFLLGLAVSAAFALGERPDWLSEYFIFLLGCMFAAVISIIAFWWKVNRWYAYAVVLVIGVAFHQWLGTPEEMSFIVLGAIVIISGAGFLLHFLRKYPKVAEEGSDDRLQSR